MKNLVKIIFITVLFLLPVFSFAEDYTIVKKEDSSSVKTIDRENYQVQIKQYKKDYPMILYVVFKEDTPLLEEIKTILKTEILTLTKTKNIENDIIIASAWFDNQVLDNLEKIELAKKYGASLEFTIRKKKAVGIVTFPEYLKYLKKKKDEDKNKAKQQTA